MTVPFRDYTIWCVGNCDHDVTPATTTPGAVLMGGGTDTDEAFVWQIGNANGGDFVVIRASGDDAYNEWIYELSIASGARLNSVRTILFNRKAASSSSEVLDLLRKSEAIFMAGGDQGVYMDYWVGTEVQTIMQSKLANITIGGTSAGLAVQGNWVYTAEDGSAYSDEALANPYDKHMNQIVPAFLKIPYMDTIFTDTHFVTRDRMGRMLTFVARIRAESSDSAVPIVRGLGVDEHTALLLDTRNGNVETVGVNTAYLCTATKDAEVCSSKTPLTFTGLSCVRFSGRAGDKYSFSSFTGSGVTYTNDIRQGVFTTLPYGPI